GQQPDRPQQLPLPLLGCTGDTARVGARVPPGPTSPVDVESEEETSRPVSQHLPNARTTGSGPLALGDNRTAEASAMTASAAVESTEDDCTNLASRPCTDLAVDHDSNH